MATISLEGWAARLGADKSAALVRGGNSSVNRTTFVHHRTRAVPSANPFNLAPTVSAVLPSSPRPGWSRPPVSERPKIRFPRDRRLASAIAKRHSLPDSFPAQDSGELLSPPF